MTGKNDLLDDAPVPYFEGFRCIGVYYCVKFNREYDYFRLQRHPVTNRIDLTLVFSWSGEVRDFDPIYVRAEYGQPVVNLDGVPVVMVNGLNDAIDELSRE